MCSCKPLALVLQAPDTFRPPSKAGGRMLEHDANLWHSPVAASVVAP
jgi:hypothetical protein